MNHSEIARRIASDSHGLRTSGKLDNLIRLLQGKPSQENLTKSVSEFAKASEQIIFGLMEPIHDSYGKIRMVYYGQLDELDTKFEPDKVEFLGTKEGYVVLPEYLNKLQAQYKSDLDAYINSISGLKSVKSEILESPFLKSLEDLSKKDKLAKDVYGKIKDPLESLDASVTTALGFLNGIKEEMEFALGSQKPNELQEHYMNYILKPAHSSYKKINDKVSSTLKVLKGVA